MLYYSVCSGIGGIKCCNIQCVKCLEAKNDLILINESLLASSSGDNSIRIWDLTLNKEKFILNGHSYRVYGLKLLTPNILASVSLDETIKLWNIQNGFEIRTFSLMDKNILVRSGSLTLQRPICLTTGPVASVASLLTDSGAFSGVDFESL